eukprot:36013-Pleurochrysis_carterae.AAC.2
MDALTDIGDCAGNVGFAGITIASKTKPSKGTTMIFYAFGIRDRLPICVQTALYRASTVLVYQQMEAFLFRNV